MTSVVKWAQFWAQREKRESKRNRKGTAKAKYVFDLGGERGRNRTYNLLIKSQLLCQLSYAPVLG